MFNQDFYPTPPEVIARMLEGIDVDGKTILEPSAGAGNIVDHLLEQGAAEVLVCEKDPRLAEIAKTKGRFLKHDFMEVTSDEISHIDLIVMNPPFSADEKHILHAWEIAPNGATIVALANNQTLSNPYHANRKILYGHVESYGERHELGPAFQKSERTTGVDVDLIILRKPADAYQTEFEGFFMDEEPEVAGSEGVMPYNVVRDLVNRYVQAVKIWDQQAALAVQLNSLTSDIYNCNVGLQFTANEKPTERATFKKEMQKAGWEYLFRKLNMRKMATRGLREDINKFVEQQNQYPFTMRNIYRMLEIVVGTTGQRMDKALEEVFDKLTTHHHDNRYNVEGWKTNSHYLVNRKFILPHCIEKGWQGEPSVKYHYSEEIDDLDKALCYLTATRYEDHERLGDLLRNQRGNIQWGQWFDWAFWEVRVYKKGTAHFKFKSEKVWEQFNQRIAKIKGYPLFEAKPKTKNSTTKPKHSSPGTGEVSQAKRSDVGGRDGGYAEPEVLFKIAV